MGNNAPEGYLSCDGTIYKISEYPKLAELIKGEFGSYNYFGGDGESTFAVPDLRGEFLRGTGTTSRNTGTGSSVGIHQDPTQFPYIRGSSSIVWSNAGNISSPDTLNQKTGGTNKVSVAGDNFRRESDYYTSRPTNTAVLYCIKY